MKAVNRWDVCWLPLQALEARVVLSADLVIDSVTSPALADLGTTIAVSWVGRNAGDEATGGEFGWSDGLYLSADDVLDENDLYLGEFYADRVNPVLAAGETYEIFAQIYLPFDATLGTGEYRLIVSADLGGSEAEGDEGNNTRVSGAMGVSVPTLPDLTVGEINAGALGRFGEDFSISWTITNSGLGSTFVDVTDAVYLSTDDVLDSSDLWVDVSQITLPAGPLAPGESITIEATARLPIDSALGAGSYRLIVVADGYSMQAETDEENNTLASSPIEVSLATPPDLIVENVVSVASGEFGNAITLTWTVRNAGDGSAAWWADEVYLSSDAILDASDYSLISMDAYGNNGQPLAPGQSIQMQATLRLPDVGALAAGTYQLLVKSDAWEMVAESDESNNVGASGSVVIGDPTASDLVVDSGVAPTSGELGQTIEVSWVVRNQGSGSASTWGWSDAVYLSLDGVIGEGDLQVGWSSPEWLGALRLAAGESLAGLTTVWLPQDGTLQPGTYQLIIASDVDGRVFDSDRTNNTLAIATIEITGQVLPPEFNPELNPGGGPGLWPQFGSVTGSPLGDGSLRSSTNGSVSPISPGIGAGGEMALGAIDANGITGTGGNAGDLVAGLFTWSERAGSQAGSRGLSKITLRVASESAAPVVRSNFVQ